MPISVGYFLHVLVIKSKDVFSHSYNVGPVLCRLVTDQAGLDSCPNQGRDLGAVEHLIGLLGMMVCLVPPLKVVQTDCGRVDKESPACF